MRLQPWFRPDRLRIFRINWTEGHLRTMLGQRLTFFSDRGDRTYQQLGQLCSPDLADHIDDELVRLAEGLPRAALVLAELLLRTHCETSDPAEQIAPATWKEVQFRGQPCARTSWNRMKSLLPDSNQKSA